MQPILKEIGLTESEIKVYLSLLELGSSTAGPIIDKSKISSSKIYEVLERLMQKGLISYIIKSKTKYFDAEPPKRIKQYLKEKQKQLEDQEKALNKIIPELELKRKLAQEKNEASVFKGLKAIKNFYLNILTELKSKEEYYVLGANYGDYCFVITSFFENYHKQRVKKGIKLKMLANKDAKATIVPSCKRNSQIKFLPKDLMTNMMTIFYKNKAFICFLTKEPTGFLIENQEVVEGFKTYFKTFWKVAKP